MLVRDPKASATHAKVEIDGKGQLVLMDLGSSNGLYINNRRVKKVALLPGVTFEIGRTKFKVLKVEEQDASDFSRVITWRSSLKRSLRELSLKNEFKENSVEAFSSPVVLSFLEGIQADTQITLGYGPREAGADSLDIELLDPDAPGKAFVIVPEAGSAQIQILVPGRVQLNNRTPRAETLKDGDLISLGSTVIKVTYL
ncbi:FHA domain protein [compost metagenome]